MTVGGLRGGARQRDIAHKGGVVDSPRFYFLKLCWVFFSYSERGIVLISAKKLDFMF